MKRLYLLLTSSDFDEVIHHNGVDGVVGGKAKNHLKKRKTKPVKLDQRGW